MRRSDKSDVAAKIASGAATVDYRKYYSREEYIFGEVGPKFQKTGHIDPADFYLILIWKAERSKTRHRKRMAKTAGSFAAAVKEIASSLHATRQPEVKLKLIMEKWSPVKNSDSAATLGFFDGLK
jgi:hypothetical protein